MRNIRLNLLAAVGLAFFALTAASAQASTLQIQFTGLDLVYDGVDIFDAKSPFGGGTRTSGPAMFDLLTSASGWSAMPEPASVLLLGAGLLGLAGFLRKAK